MSDARNRFNRRSFMARGVGGMAALALAGAGGELLSACGSSGSSATISYNPKAGIGSGRPKRGGTITVGMDSEIDGFLPSVDHWDNTGLTYGNTVFETLTRIAPDGTVYPYLAESLTPNADLTVWTVTLRPGITFHDGSAFNADVVAANFNALTTSPLTGKVTDVISSVKTTGDLELQFLTTEPLVAFPHYLTQSIQVGAVAALSQLDSQNTQVPVGTGPFKYVSWEPNDHFTVERNPNYWRSGLPYLDSITFKPIIEDASRLDSLRSGTVDLMVSHDPNAIAQLSSNSSYQQVTDLKQTVGQPDMDFICFDTSKPPLDDLTVRQALVYGTDRETIVRVFDAGIGQQVQSSLFPPGSPYHPADNGYPGYDLSKAKKLYQQAAARNGGQIEFTLGDIPDPRQTEIIQALQSMWQNIGFKVNLTSIQQVTYIDNLVSGSFQAYADEQFSATDPDLNYVWLSTTTASGAIALNFARNADPAIEAALQEGRTNSDPAVRAEAYQTVDKQLAKDLPYLWFARAPWSLSGADNVQNFNGPTIPNVGLAEGFRAGVFIPTEIWVT